MNIKISAQTERIYTLDIATNDTKILADEIALLLADNPKKFQYAPIILHIIDKKFQANELAILIEILTQNNLVAIGIRGGKQELIDFAQFSGLAIFSSSSANKTDKPAAKTKKIKTDKPAAKTKKIKKTQPKPHQASIFGKAKVVIKTVPAFTQILADNRDLVLLGKVEKDAELISTGSIMAYQTVHGRVFAGIDGDENVSIFIQSFNPQLVAIAGVWKKFKIAPSKLYKHPVRVDLHNGKLRFKRV